MNNTKLQALLASALGDGHLYPNKYKKINFLMFNDYRNLNSGK